LPFASINRFAIGEFTLRLAVLMYSCEFIIAKSYDKNILPIITAAILSMLIAIAKAWHFIF